MQDYYLWGIKSGTREQSFEGTQPVIGEDDRLKAVVKTASSFDKHVWSHWDSANSSQASQLEEENALEIARFEADNYATQSMRNWMRKKNKGVQEIRSIDFDTIIDLEKVQILVAPFWIILFSHNGSSYAFAIDAIDGSYFGGDRPLNLKNIAKAAGAVACGSALLLALASLWGQKPADESYSIAQVVTTEEVPISDNPYLEDPMAVDYHDEVRESPVFEASDTSAALSTQMPPPAEQEEGQAFPAPPSPPQTGGGDGDSTSYSEHQKGALQSTRSTATQWGAAELVPASRPIVMAESAPSPDPSVVANCANLTARLRDGEGKLKSLGFDAQIRNINGLSYEQSGPIIAKALVLTQRYNVALRGLSSEQCVQVAQQGIGQINALLSPLAGQR